MNTVDKRKLKSEYDKVYSKANAERIKARRRAYYQRNKDRIAAKNKLRRKEIATRMKEWREKNKEKISKYEKLYREANKDRYQKLAQTWNYANRDRKRALQSRRRTRIASGGGSFTAREFSDLCEKYGNKCIGPGPHHGKLTADHVVPVSKGGSSNIDNIQPLCSSCNSRKRDHIIDYR